MANNGSYFSIRRPLNKKGTEKPMEIFVAFFIILAVAMVMLKMFKTQITDKTNDMKNMQQEADLANAKIDARQKCEEICSTSNQNGCSLKDKVNFCIAKVNSLDLNGDRATDGIDTTILGGLPICEDGIYCSHYTECKCGSSLTFKNCVEIMCQYYADTEEGLAMTTGCGALLNKQFSIGTCTKRSNTERNEMWDFVTQGGKYVVDDQPGTLACTGTCT